MPYLLEPAKWAFLVIYLVLSAISNWAVLSYIHDIVPSGPLPDVVYMLIPEQEWASYAADYMVSCCIICLFLLVFFHEGGLIIMRRTVFIAATLYSMRAITLMITQLPPGYANIHLRCREQINATRTIIINRLNQQIVNMGFQEKDDMLCGDLLFSGHTLIMTSCALTVAYYLPRQYSPLHFISSTFATFGAICLIISRTHYSTDVVIAYWLTSFVFRIYHAYCEAEVIIIREDSVLHGIWWIRIVDWLEERIVPGRIRNTFRLPFVSVLYKYNSSIPHEKFDNKTIDSFAMA